MGQAGDVFSSPYGSFTRPLLPPAGKKQQLKNLQGHDMFFKHLLEKLHFNKYFVENTFYFNQPVLYYGAKDHIRLNCPKSNLHYQQQQCLSLFSLAQTFTLTEH